ncbi:ABC transporter permease subunit [Erysipelothrix sp. HDW6C]|uniref:ABC transporter permease subunit n=1 Tax=Erysipelothrix sp. HDW6C TaxID=2714930 RepID=UPI001408FF97|nr:ABC transporter permease subunit [Erysipelothrix sp. HDW6C]QIK70493.1 ABC transporter permease subunit [Erysipelothrix sp. HDW6C]
MKKKKKSLFTRLFAPGGMRHDDIEEMIDDNVVISPTKQIVQNFFSNKLGVFGLTVFVLIFAIVFGSTALMDYDMYDNEPTLNNLAPGTGFVNPPKEIQGKNIVSISSGTSFTVALDDQGKVYFWGQNPEKKYDVKSIVALTEGKKVKMIEAGDKHVIAVTEDNEFIGAGSNTFNQSEIDFRDPMGEPSPKDLLKGEKIKQLATGIDFSAILTENDRIIVWGSTLPNNLNNIPKELQGETEKLIAGSYNIITIMKDGSLRVFGQKGTEITAIPENLTDGSVKVVDVVIASNTAMALDSEGNVHTWGSAQYGALNVPEHTGNIVDISATRSSLSILDDAHNVQTWGRGKFGLTELPTAVKNGNIESIHGDFFSSYAISSDNQVTGWGNNGFRLGSDAFGRDVLTRLLQGGRISLTVGAVAMIISTIIGVFVGLIAGYYGKWVDNLLMRFAEVVSAFPFIPLAITLSAFLPIETSQEVRITMIMVILGVISWPGVARLVRGQILAEREKDFVLAARALGLKEGAIMLKHILPSVVSFIIVSMTLGYAGSLLTEAGLSYLGFGVTPPSPSWGNMLTGAAKTYVLENYMWQWILPSVCVLATALSVNFIGDALRDAMDPRSNQK